jgi:hypothetical protein
MIIPIQIGFPFNIINVEHTGRIIDIRYLNGCQQRPVINIIAKYKHAVISTHDHPIVLQLLGVSSHIIIAIKI